MTLRTTIVVPCFNEADRLDPLPWHSWAGAHPHVRFLFVDDGSTDRTSDALAVLCAHGQLSMLTLAHNVGKAEAVRTGLNHAMEDDAQVVGFWDADLATPLDDISAMLATLEADPSLEWVFGSRVRLFGTPIHRLQRRHYVGRVAATLASRLLGLAVYDTQCGAKLFRRPGPWAQVFATPFLTRWAFDVEVLARWRAAHPTLGAPQLETLGRELPVSGWSDVPGSKLRVLDVILAPWALLRIWWAHRG